MLRTSAAFDLVDNGDSGADGELACVPVLSLPCVTQPSCLQCRYLGIGNYIRRKGRVLSFLHWSET